MGAECAYAGLVRLRRAALILNGPDIIFTVSIRPELALKANAQQTNSAFALAAPEPSSPFLLFRARLRDVFVFGLWQVRVQVRA